MLGRGRIVQAQEAQAALVRERIRDLENALVGQCSEQVKKRPGDFSYEIKVQKFRLERIEECLAGLRVGSFVVSVKADTLTLGLPASPIKTSARS